MPPRSKILLPGRRHPPPKNRTLNLHVHLIKRVHNRLDPVLVHLRKELLDGLFCLRGGRVRGYGCAGPCSVCDCGLGRSVQKEEFDIYSTHFISQSPREKGRRRRERPGRALTSTRNEARDVVIVEAVYALEIPRQQY
jgi:hypothetical protein